MTTRQKSTEMLNIMKPTPHRVLQIIRQTNAEYTFRVEYPGETKNGQFFMFPNQKAAEIAVKTVRTYKENENSRIKVIFNVWKDIDYEIYRQLLG